MSSRLVIWGGIAAVVLALAGAVYVQTLRLDSAKAEAALLEQQRDQARADAAQNAKAADEIAAHAVAVRQAMGQEMADAQARANDLQALIEEIDRAPDSDACSNSAPIRALLDGLRRS